MEAEDGDKDGVEAMKDGDKENEEVKGYEQVTGGEEVKEDEEVNEDEEEAEKEGGEV